MEFLKKLTSRKFLAAMVGLLAGLAVAFGLDRSVVTAVAGAVTAAASVVSYIASEGKIDAAAVGRAAQAAEDARQLLSDGPRSGDGEPG